MKVLVFWVTSLAAVVSRETRADRLEVRIPLPEDRRALDDGEESGKSEKKDGSKQHVNNAAAACGYRRMGRGLANVFRLGGVDKGG